MARLSAVLLAAALVGSVFAAAAIEMLDLYQARPIVTGTGEKNRAIGFDLALREVLFKVSGNPRLLDDPRVARIDPKPLITRFTYRDRMEGIPIHDEQGSHDRPHDLTVTFDAAKLDAALATLGEEPWRDPRPTLVVVLGVTNGDRTFVLSADGERGVDMRESLANASFRTNMPAVVPSQAALAAAGVTVDGLAAATPAKLEPLAEHAGGDRVVVGTLQFSDADHGWLVDWRTTAPDGTTAEWHQRGVSFDDAFRAALRGAAQVLSGHGAPVDQSG